jgi:spore maturation protein CgeB
MRIAIITTSYPAFLRELYSNTPGLECKSYSEQLAARNDSLFGFADFYSRGFRAHGHQAAEFHLNNFHLQAAWAREHGLPAPQLPPTSTTTVPLASALHRIKGSLKSVLRPLARAIIPPNLRPWQARILRAQIEAFQPDIIYNQEPATVRGRFVDTLRRPGRWVVGQIASALPAGENFKSYDLMVSSLPNFVAFFRSNGVPSAYNRLAFEPLVRDAIGSPVRDIALSFVGNLSSVHHRRVALLEHVAERLPLKIWGSGLERLPPSSVLHKCFQGEAWGRKMLEILARSQITLNNHEAVAGNYANNLRLYEATGMGALLLTDWKSDLDDILASGEELVAYESPMDCVSVVEKLLADGGERTRIAAAGQRRTMNTHNYLRRTGELLQIFEDVMAGNAKSLWLSSVGAVQSSVE